MELLIEPCFEIKVKYRCISEAVVYFGVFSAEINFGVEQSLMPGQIFFCDSFEISQILIELGLLGGVSVQFSLEFCIILISLGGRCVDICLDPGSFFLQFKCLGIDIG